MTKSICDDCLTAHCAWRAPTGGIDPPVIYCTAKTRQKPVTEGDRVRSMPDEDLAHFMARVCPPNAKCQDSCYLCRLDWLRQEVKPDA